MQKCAIAMAEINESSDHLLMYINLEKKDKNI